MPVRKTVKASPTAPRTKRSRASIANQPGAITWAKAPLTPTRELFRALEMRSTHPSRARSLLLRFAWECPYARLRAEAVVAYAGLLSPRSRGPKLLELIHHLWQESAFGDHGTPREPIRLSGVLLDRYPDLFDYVPARDSVGTRLTRDSLIACDLIATVWRHRPQIAEETLRHWAIFPYGAPILQALARAPGALAALPEAVWTAWLTSGVAENRLQASLLLPAYRLDHEAVPPIEASGASLCPTSRSRSTRPRL